jgi:hypothetical protein
VHESTPSCGRTSTVPPRHCAPLDSHLLCARLHDPEHVHHLYAAGMVFTINIVMACAVPSLLIQMLITVAFFGRDTITILLE